MKLPSASYLIEMLYIRQPRVREQVTRAVYGAKDRVVEIFNKRVAINSLKENGYYRAARLSRRSSLLRDEVVVFNRLPYFFEPGMTFVDVGANVGIFSIMMADFQNLIPDFRVIAFEVHPGTFSRLKHNAAEHGFIAHNVGISSANAERNFVEGAVSHVTTMEEDANQYSILGRTFSAKVARLDSFDIQGSIAMKIDVEGHEFDVLQGSESLFEAGRVNVVYIDGFNDDPRVPEFLIRHGLVLIDCQTLKPAASDVSMLLAVKQ